ncbi:MAG: DUF512 domain-containing protein [Clostridia bacterium]|nr:DUF512 domain-containing protein [Clostridia bacterium]
MAVVIDSVAPRSKARWHGIKPGDKLLEINKNKINDVLDYRFYITDEKLELLIETKSGKKRTVKIRNRQGSEIGLSFATYLMDKQRRCANNCIFCFIDQLPEGLRESLYFKDDDSRLSFFFGNYITLTNLKQEDIDRIIKMHISPINISVHTTNPELRVKMMGNKRAGQVLDYIRQLADAGIELHTQLVLCPGYNDGEELTHTLNDLGKLYPSLKSIACVPVGISCHRDGLTQLTDYTKEQALDVISRINIYNDEFVCYNKTNIAYASDEFYIKAGLQMPEASRYGDFDQLEDGVGLWTLLKDEFYEAVNGFDYDLNNQNRKVTIATGVAAYPLMCELACKAEEICQGLTVNVVEVENRLFGNKINVAGLICGEDYYYALKDLDLGEELLIPAVSLRHEGDMFIDDVTLDELSERLNIKITPVRNDGYELLSKIAGKG